MQELRKRITIFRHHSDQSYSSESEESSEEAFSSREFEDMKGPANSTKKEEIKDEMLERDRL